MIRRSILTRQRLVAVFLGGLLLFFSPLPSLFARAGGVAGIPALYLYLFGAWALLIAATAWIVGGRDE